MRKFLLLLLGGMALCLQLLLHAGGFAPVRDNRVCDKIVPLNNESISFTMSNEGALCLATLVEGYAPEIASVGYT